MPHIPTPTRIPLPDDERAGLTVEFDVLTRGPTPADEPESHHGRLTVNTYPDDGRPGEIFLRLGPTGSTMAGLCDLWGRAVSLLLQYGVPLEDVLHKFGGFQFEPQGWVDGYGYVKSVADLVVKVLERFRSSESGVATTAGAEAGK